MVDIVVYGAGGLGREVHEALESMNEDRPCWRIMGFLVDHGNPSSSTVHDLPILGGPEWLDRHPAVQVIVAVGNSQARRDLYRRLGNRDHATVIHPRATVARSAHIGPGSMILPGATVSSDAVVGQGVLLNPGVRISHDCRVGDFSSLGPNAALAGSVVIGEACEIGTGASIIPHVVVGRDVVVGAGAVIIRSVESGTTVKGVPAR